MQRLLPNEDRRRHGSSSTCPSFRRKCLAARRARDRAWRPSGRRPGRSVVRRRMHWRARRPRPLHPWASDRPRRIRTAPARLDVTGGLRRDPRTRSRRDRDLVRVEQREVDRAALAPGREHRLDAVLRRPTRDLDVERQVAEVGAAPSMPDQPAQVGRPATPRRSRRRSRRRTAARACRAGTRRAQPASAPSRYAVGLGARFSPPRRGGRSASQLNDPAESRARPLASVAVTVGAERAFAGSSRKRASARRSRSVIVGLPPLRRSTGCRSTRP